jgi:hypothetical protein
LVVLLSVPLTLFLWDWHIGWVTIGKLIFGTLAILFWMFSDPAGVLSALRRRAVFFGLLEVVFTIMALAGVVIVNYLAHAFPWRVDLSRQQVFSLSEQTRRVVANLDADVEVLAFYGPREPEYVSLDDCLDLYSQLSDRFSARLIDPIRRQDLVERYMIRDGGPRLIVRSRSRRARAKIERNVHGCPEQAITNAVMSVTATGERQEICFLTGHGEYGIHGRQDGKSCSRFAGDLRDDGYRTTEISLLELDAMPSPCKVLIIAGPERDLLPSELEIIGSYLDSGGRLLSFLGAADSLSMDALLSGYGVILDKDTVVSGGHSPVLVASDPRSYPRAHPVFKRLAAGGASGLRRLQAVFPLARSIRRNPDPPRNLVVVELASSGPGAWGEADKLAIRENHAFDAGRDLQGPLSLAVSVDARAGQRNGPRMIVFGSSLMLDDSAYRLFPLNRDLIISSLAWLAGDENKIAIHPRFREASLLALDRSQLQLLAIFTTDLLPLLILILGFTIWRVRRWS